MGTTGENSVFITEGALVTDSKIAGLVTPYNLPKTVNIFVTSTQNVLLGAISVDNLRSKSSTNSFTGSLIVHKQTEHDGLVFVSQQPIEFKTNRSPLKKHIFDLLRPITIEPNCDYRLRFVFDNSWVPRNFYCLSKIVQYDTKIDETITITIRPEKVNGDVIENELPLILYFNRL